jgi:glyoxylase-like metal-dependent hydrolase (beta-lactamase superfamily II)
MENELPGPAEVMGAHWGEWLHNEFYLVVARNMDRTVVVNSGTPRDMTLPNEFQRRFAERSVPRIRAPMPQPLLDIGVQPSDVDLLILTPFTYYTTGNLSLFSKAEICMLRRGWMDFMAPDPYTPQLPRPITIDSDQLKWLVTDGWAQVRLLHDEDEPAPGIRTWFAGSHHRSTMAVEIETERGLVLYSDAFFRYENLEKNAPIGVCESMEEAYRTYERVRKSGAIVLPMLDPEVLVRYPGGRVSNASAKAEEA